MLRSENDEESLGAKFALNLPQPADSIINSAVHFPIFCCCCFFFVFFFIFLEPVVHMCYAMRPSVYEDIYNKPAMVFFIYLFISSSFRAMIYL